MVVDLILCNGRVHTMDPRLPVARAVAVKGQRILAVDDEGDLDDMRGPHTQTIDLRGRVLLPAFADGHMHLEKYAMELRELDLSAVASASEAAAVVRSAGRAEPAGSWLRGMGWHRHSWDDPRPPTKALLDQAAPHHPVALSSKDLHSLWVNSLALRAAGITTETPDPPGGVIVRDPQTGEPTGLLLETACKLVSAVCPTPSPHEFAKAIREALPLLWAEGIVSIHQMGDWPDGRGFRALQDLRRQGDLALRVSYYAPRENLDAAIQLGLRSGLGDERLRVAGVKFFADGSLGSHTAWMLEPFLDTPDDRGVPWLPPEELRRNIGDAARAGLAVAVHALGDRANREVLDGFAAIRARGMEDDSAGARTPTALRHRIEHVQLLHPDDVPRLAQLDIIASMQPIHVTSDVVVADRLWGGPRNQGAYAWRSLLDANAELCFGSDAPVESPSVLAGIHAAVTRRRPDGSPGAEGWHPEQRLTVAQAVHAYTLGAARAVGEAGSRGSISPSKLADLVVLSDDIFGCDPMEIVGARVDLTILDGEVVYSRSGEGKGG